MYGQAFAPVGFQIQTGVEMVRTHFRKIAGKQQIVPQRRIEVLCRECRPMPGYGKPDQRDKDRRPRSHTHNPPRSE
jgi:hypothetical protein